jgi:hypothetical protein
MGWSSPPKAPDAGKNESLSRREAQTHTFVFPLHSLSELARRPGDLYRSKPTITSSGCVCVIATWASLPLSHSS